MAGPRTFSSGQISLVTSDAETLVSASVPEKKIQWPNNTWAKKNKFIPSLGDTLGEYENSRWKIQRPEFFYAGRHQADTGCLAGGYF